MELARGDRTAQVVLELDPLRHLIAHRLVEHRHRVAPAVLGLVHGGVRVADQCLGGRMRIVTGSEGEPDAGRDVELHPIEDERVPKAEAQPIRQVERLRDAHHAVQKDHELVAADPGDKVRGPHIRLKALGHFHKEIVAVAVPERVVHQLEPVQVQEEKRHVRVVDPPPLQQPRQVLFHHATVGEPGQAVMIGLVDEARFRTRCDVKSLRRCAGRRLRSGSRSTRT